MADPGWPSLMTYIRRLTYVMAMGRPDAKIALYLPSSSLWLGDAASDVAFVSTERMLSERQIDFDIIDLDALATDLKSGPGIFETLSGNRYHTVILPSLAVISQPELDRLRQFANSGGKVLFLGRTPALISQKTILDARAGDPRGLRLGVHRDLGSASADTPTPARPAARGSPAPMEVPAAIEKAVNAVTGAREVSLETPDAALKVTTRRLKDAGVYLFFNEGPQPINHAVTLRASGVHGRALGPADRFRLRRSHRPPPKGSITVKLALQPYETRLIFDSITITGQRPSNP